MLVIDAPSVRIAALGLLAGASARVPAGARVGLIGRNGAGKSTLFRVIAGDIAPEHGAIELPARARIGRLPQEAPDGPESLIEIVLAADRERGALLAEAERASDPHRIAEIQTRLADIGAHAAPARAAGILAGLGFSHQDQQRPCQEFSGGWRMRVALAAVLFAEPDLLLLDEPTNYLDLEGTLWLEAHIARYPHTVIVISHDRDLLDNGVDSILHLDNRRLTFYRGGYTSFERQRRERQALDQKFAKKQEAERKRIIAFVDRSRAPATRARRAQSPLKLRGKLEPAAARVADEVREIVIPEPDRPLSPPIIAFDGVAAAYEPGKPVLRRVTLRIDNDDRIALLGQNGNGKSTLTKLISGRLAPSEGRITRADRLKVAYFAQHQLDELDPAGSAYDHVRRLMPDAPEARVRARRRHARPQAVGRREVAPAARARVFRGTASGRARRADQPSRHRQPGGADRGDQRFRRRRHPGFARSLSAGGLRRPVVAGAEWRRRALRGRPRRLSPSGARDSQRRGAGRRLEIRRAPLTRRDAARRRGTTRRARPAQTPHHRAGGRDGEARQAHGRDRTGAGRSEA